MNYRSNLLYIASMLCLLSSPFHVEVFANDAVEDQYDCPDDNAAFVTTCSGVHSEQGDAIEESATSSIEDEHIVDDEKEYEDVTTNEDDLNQQQEASVEGQSEDNKLDDSDLVQEVLEESLPQQPQESRTQTCTPNFGDNSHSDENNFHDESDDIGTNVKKQLQHTFIKLTHRYYNPLPDKAKCAVGTICGFASSRLALGVANRIVRLTGAIWVASEVLHTSGFCDETKCVPEEMRPWIGIIRRALIKQCIRVRMLARKIYDKEEIRAIAQKDGMFSGGFASGAFVGFVV